jgi:tetratricopeptide (TPR) repeat protein
MSQGNAAEALIAQREASRFFESIGDIKTLVVERFGELSGMCELGLFRECVEVATDALVAAQQLGLGFSMAVIRMALGTALLGLDERAQAKEAFELSAAFLGGRTPIEWWPRAYLSKIALLDGDTETALGHATRAAQCGEELGPALGAALASVATVRLARGELDEAVRFADRALSVVDMALGVRLGDSTVRATYVRVHDALGQSNEAHRELARKEATSAARKIHERADAIADPAWRASYLALPDRKYLLDYAG